jgi:hypothetical protein
MEKVYGELGENRIPNEHHQRLHTYPLYNAHGRIQTLVIVDILAKLVGLQKI